MSDSNDSATGACIDNDSLGDLLPNRSGSSNATMSDRAARRSQHPSLHDSLALADLDAVFGLEPRNGDLYGGRGIARVTRGLPKAAPGFQPPPLELSSDT